jgi:hypothetical protein
MRYQPPRSSALRELKERLGYTNGQMADLFGVSTGRQFHKYISDEDRREMGFHVLMYGVLQLLLKEGAVTDIAQLHAIARELGATIEVEEEK